MISVRNLSFAYTRSSRPAVEDMSFRVESGEVFGFLGPSGAGKSTTQNILIGLLRGWRGSIEVLGKDLSAWGREYYRQIGVHFELPNHYAKLSARENLAFFGDLYDGHTEEPDALLSLVGLEDHADKRVSEYSKGMKNRLTLARSLLNRPKLWFLDEPTSGLDPVNAVRVRELVQARQREGTTTVITTHDMHVADLLCDRVAFIVDGRIVECEAPDTLKHRFGKREVRVTYGLEQSPTTEDFALDGLGENRSFQRVLREESLISMHSQETTLEDVFVKVTGRTLT